MAMNSVSSELRRKMEKLVKIETHLSYSACSLVSAGVGVALIDPLTALAWDTQGLVTKPFSPAIPYNVSIVRSALQPASRIARQFVEELQNGIDRRIKNYSLSPITPGK